MSTQNTTRSRRIVLNAFVAKAPGSEMAISLVDEAGAQLDRACVKEDGSCQLSEEALASADGVIVEPGSVLVAADRFRVLIGTKEPVDVTALLGDVKRASLRGHTPGNHNGPPPGGGGPPKASGH